MIDEQKQQIIQNLLLARKRLINEAVSSSKDYAEVRERILLTELRYEISLLEEMLNDLPNFAERFKQRFAERAKYQDNSLALAVMPTNLTNELYWNIAQEVFKPNALTREVLNIQLETQEQLTNLILNFSPAFYEVLWQNLTLRNPEHCLKDFANSIATGFFNPEQKQALAIAITKGYSRLNRDESILFWALRTNEPLFLQEALRSYDEDQRLMAVMELGVHGLTILDKTIDEPHFLKAIFDLLSSEERYRAVKLTNEYGLTMLDMTADKPESLKVILNSLSPKQKHSLVKIKLFGRIAIDNPKSRGVFIGLLGVAVAVVFIVLSGMAFGPLGMGVAEVVSMIGLFAVANKTHALLSLAADEHLESPDTGSMSSDSNENRT